MRPLPISDEFAGRLSSSETAEVTPHVLRHTFATSIIQKGGSLAALKKILGHDRLTTTEIYLNLTDEHIVQEYKQK